jgi:hypothetical protein
MTALRDRPRLLTFLLAAGAGAAAYGLALIDPLLAASAVGGGVVTAFVLAAVGRVRRAARGTAAAGDATPASPPAEARETTAGGLYSTADMGTRPEWERFPSRVKLETAKYMGLGDDDDWEDALRG